MSSTKGETRRKSLQAPGTNTHKHRATSAALVILEVFFTNTLSSSWGGAHLVLPSFTGTWCVCLSVCLHCIYKPLLQWELMAMVLMVWQQLWHHVADLSIGQTPLKTSCYFNGRCEQLSHTMRLERAVKDRIYTWDMSIKSPKWVGSLLE